MRSSLVSFADLPQMWLFVDFQFADPFFFNSDLNLNIVPQLLIFVLQKEDGKAVIATKR